MRFTRIKLENWRNFLNVDVPLQRRIFLLGPNASGKSNFLDAFRFLRDIADPQGGLQRAVQTRRGISQIRSLHARRGSVVVEVGVDLEGESWEEPELSLHPEVVRYIPSVMARLSRKSGRQILVSTHSEVLLSDPGIAPEEVLLLDPSAADTKVRLASEDEQVRTLAENGLPIGEIVLPMTAPRDAQQLAL